MSAADLEMNNLNNEPANNTDADAFIDKAISEHDVTLFGKRTCPFTIEALNILKSLKGVEYGEYLLDEMKGDIGKQIQKTIASRTNHQTVPMIYILGEFIGGCTDLANLNQSGKLSLMLAKKQKAVNHVELEVKEEEEEYTAEKQSMLEKGYQGPRDVYKISFLQFPVTVNGHVARMSGIITTGFCVTGVIFRNYDAMAWATLVFAVDFFLRFLCASHLSPVALISQILVLPFEPHFAPGAPKQFANFVGFCFSAIAAGLYLGGLKTAGAVVLAMLAGAASLQGFLNFCLGCWMFGLAVNLGIVSPSIYKPHVELLRNKEYTYNRMRTLFTEVPEKESRFTPSGYKASDVDLKHKNRIWNGDYKAASWNFIKYLNPIYFMAPTALSGLSYVWYFNWQQFGSSKITWQILSITSAAVFGALFILYALQAILYPQRIAKAWAHPVQGSAIFAITISFMILGFLVKEADLRAAQILVWIGAGVNMALTLLKTSEWFFNKWSQGNINASWIIVPASNLIAAIFLPPLSDAYVEPAKFWFGTGIALTGLFAPVALYAAIVDHASDQRSRPALAFFPILPTIILASYLSISGGEFDLFASVFFYFSLFMTAVFGLGFLKHYFFAPKFVMSYWAFGFLFDTIALASIAYDINLNTGFSNVLRVLFLYVSSFAVATLGLYTLFKLLDGDLFVPESKWGPMSFMKMTHEAFRSAIPRVIELLQNLENVEDANVLDLIANELSSLLQVLAIHAKHEESIIFPELEKLFPGITDLAHKDHESHDAVESFIKDFLSNFHQKRIAEKDSLIQFKEKCSAFLTDLLVHLRTEETTVTQVVKKYIPSEFQKKITTDAFEVTTAEEIQVFIPWVLNNLRMPQQRLQFVKTWTWAMPYRAQEIGLIVYRGVSDVLYAELADCVPEIIPRGAQGWRRVY